MKQNSMKRFLNIYALIMVSFGFIQCHTGNMVTPKKENSAEISAQIFTDKKGVDMKITVASETRTGFGVAPLSCFLVKYSPEASSWQYLYDTIEGYEYEAGYEYVLLVNRLERKNVPQDASKYVYRLKKILNKQKKHSEGMP